MRSPRRWLAGLLCAAALQAAAAVQLVDDRGVTVTLPRPPQRVVTLLPSLTETVCELGACDRLVGVDSFSHWPAQVAKLPHIGGVDDANVEAVVALKPDVVLLGATSRVASRLEQLGVPVVGLEPKTLADVQRVVQKAALLLGTGSADAVWRRVDEGIAAAARSVPPARRGLGVYFEIGSDGYAASASSHIGELLARLGAVNIVPGHLGTVPKLNPEFVVRADPAVIMVSARSAHTLRQRPGWARIRALREGRVCAFDSAQEDVIMRPGPRLAEAAHLLARCLAGAP